MQTLHDQNINLETFIDRNHREFVDFAHLLIKGKGTLKDAEDIMQNIYFELYNKPTNINNLRAFLYRLIKYHCATFVIRSIKMSSIDECPFEIDLPANNSPEDLLIKKEDKKELLDEFGRRFSTLNFEEKVIFVLRHIKEKPYREIEDIIQRPIGTLHSIFFRAMKKLQRKINE